MVQMSCPLRTWSWRPSPSIPNPYSTGLIEAILMERNRKRGNQEGIRRNASSGKYFQGFTGGFVYPLCKAVAVCCLPSPCSDMNVTLGSLIFSGALLLDLLAASQCKE